MPSLQHEALLLLFRNRPELAPELLEQALHVPLPAYAEVRLESSDLTDVSPAEYRADLVVLLVDGKPVLGIVVEVQLQRDDRKRFTWPVYVAGLRARIECPACLLVVTPSETVAEWCRAPIDLGPGGALCPLVIGPAAVPVVDDVARAERDPELAVLSAMAHGHEPHAEVIARAALSAVAHLSEDRAVLYSDLILAALPVAARTALEKLMIPADYEFQSDFWKRRFAEARTKGRAQGLSEGRAQAILDILEARGLAVSDEIRARVLACTDTAQLDVWLRKAATATTVEQVF
ncbi:MAG: hypothetical protein ACRENE_24605 [Polyangiaceae bacterium]